MIYTVDDVKYRPPAESGEVCGPILMTNGYGAHVVKHTNEIYELGFLVQKNYYNWSCEVDDKIRTISESNYLTGLTAEQVNTYLVQLDAL